MEREYDLDELLRQRIGEVLDEPIEDGISAEDLMFDLGMRYLRMIAQEKRKQKIRKRDPLSLWVEDAPSKKALVDYVKAVTDKTGPDYIPPFDRIAVFDLDGTIFCESDPIWFDHMVFLYRIKEDEAYCHRASDYERELADKVQSIIDTGIVPDGINVEVGHAIAHAFEGMSMREFAKYIRDYTLRPSPCFDGMCVGDAFYQPMIQVIYYLRNNGFTVYVCSGSDREMIRCLVEGGLILPSRFVIGTEEMISARNQQDIDGADYEYGRDDELVLQGRIVAKNLKMTKVSMMAQQLGQTPVLSFGNSLGDISITNYVMSNDRYRTAAFFVCGDDEVREHGNAAGAKKIYDLCADNGWTPISMKNDWKTIFLEGVTKRR